MVIVPCSFNSQNFFVCTSIKSLSAYVNKDSTMVLVPKFFDAKRNRIRISNGVAQFMKHDTINLVNYTGLTLHP